MNDPKKNPLDANPTGSVPKVVVSRLSLYLRELQHLVRRVPAPPSLGAFAVRLARLPRPGVRSRADEQRLVVEGCKLRRRLERRDALDQLLVLLGQAGGLTSP